MKEVIIGNHDTRRSRAFQAVVDEISRVEVTRVDLITCQELRLPLTFRILSQDQRCF
jgi:hypothetical protein